MSDDDDNNITTGIGIGIFIVAFLFVFLLFAAPAKSDLIGLLYEKEEILSICCIL